jgi:hypothetical protein
VSSQAGNDALDVFYGEQDAADAQGVRRYAFWLGPDGGGCVELHQLEPALPVWGSHHREVDLDIVEPGDTGSPASLDYRPTLQLQTNFDKECGNGVEVVDNDAAFSICWIVMVLLL